MSCLLTESTTNSKSRENYLRILRGTTQDFVLNEYSRSYLSEQKLAGCHMCKLKFDDKVISQGDEEWRQYLQSLSINSHKAIKLVTEAALLGSAIDHGLSPDLIILSDGAIAICPFSSCFVLGSHGKEPSPSQWSNSTAATRN